MRLGTRKSLRDFLVVDQCEKARQAGSFSQEGSRCTLFRAIRDVNDNTATSPAARNNVQRSLTCELGGFADWLALISH
jgi:hypothetical protein